MKFKKIVKVAENLIRIKIKMPYKINQYTCVKTLGQGISAKVKLAVDEDGKKVAIKIFKEPNEKTLEEIERECGILLTLGHPNIVHVIEWQKVALKVKEDGSKQRVAIIVLELIEGGELFDFVVIKNFRPEVCRFFFRQMLMAIHECHSLGFAHRDIKLENVLLDKNFNSKLADFTFCTPVEGSKGLNYSDTYLGTEGYMAPEIIRN